MLSECETRHLQQLWKNRNKSSTVISNLNSYERLVLYKLCNVCGLKFDKLPSSNTREKEYNGIVSIYEGTETSPRTDWKDRGKCKRSNVRVYFTFDKEAHVSQSSLEICHWEIQDRAGMVVVVVVLKILVG